MDKQIIIQTEELNKIYGNGDAQVQALIDINLKIQENEFVAVMGPSGSGKSTLMNILGCLDRLTSGRYYLAGEDVSSLDKTNLAIIRNQRIGFIFQSFNLLAQTSAYDNVVLPLLYNREIGVRTNGRKNGNNGNNGHLEGGQRNGSRPPVGLLNDAEQKERALRVLNAVGLGDRIHHKPQELSGGQVQRVAIARALVNDPVLILADEPTGNLDSHAGEEILNLLADLHRQGSTIVMVTHSDEIAAYAQRVIRFRDGRIESDKMNGSSHHPQTSIFLQKVSHESA